MSNKSNSGLLFDEDEILEECDPRCVSIVDPELEPIPSNTALTGPSTRWSSKVALITRPISRLHKKTPLLKRLPSFVIFPILLLIVANCAVWAIVGIILRYHPYYPYSVDLFNDSTLVGPVTLAYTFGLRHALDADHIAAIDNVFHPRS